ncbi:site-specific integrase [Variovorax humicola]|uniref:Site-specific integrase n=1 Tax=Variovorax humicola TaxID=1769758 RepID=A0ABU8VWP8_9BURK
MALYQPPGTKNWTVEFEMKGTRYRKATGTADKIKAKAIEVRMRQEAKDDAEAKRLGITRSTLGSLGDMWLAASKEHHRDAGNNASRLRKLFGEELQRDPETPKAWKLVEGARAGLPRDLPVHELTQGMLMTLKGKRKTEGNTQSTINREISLLQSLFKFAAAHNIVLPNPAIQWSVKMNKTASLRTTEKVGKTRYLTTAEEAKLLAYLATDAAARPRQRAPQDSHDLVMLLLDLGCRFTEATTLQWDAVDLDAGTVKLWRSKTQNWSTLTLSARSLEMMRERRKITAPRIHVWPAFTGKRWADEDIGRGEGADGIQAAIDAVGLNDDAGRLGRVTPHTMRHSYASRLVGAGVSLFTVQNLLGHTTPTVTQRYAHLAPSAAGIEAAAVLNALHAVPANRPAM